MCGPVWRELRKVDVANTTVGGAPVALVLTPEADQWQVFSRQLDDRVVELEFVAGQLVEIGGEGVFDLALGISESEDQDLARLPGFTSFPRDYVTFFPDGEFWTAEGVVPAS